MRRRQIIPTSLILATSLVFIFSIREQFRFSIIPAAARHFPVLNSNIREIVADGSLSSIIQNCTISEAEILGKRYTQLVQESIIWSACYPDDYLLRMYLADIGFPAHQSMLFFDVGANKGYTIATWISLWMPDLLINPLAVYEFLKTHWNISHCGHCQDCRESDFGALKLRRNTNQTIEIHAFEPQPSTYAFLNQIRQWMNLSSVYTHHQAVSNESSKALLRKCPVAEEDCGLASQSGVDSNNYVEVQTTTLDTFVKLHKITRQIDILKIDTEGFDPLVLHGADGILRRHQVRLLIFEYHYVGKWQTTSLYQVVTDLDQKGYICYQIGRTGLFRLTRCWSSKFEMRRWSNVLCLSKHESRLRLFIEELLIQL